VFLCIQPEVKAISPAAGPAVCIFNQRSVGTTAINTSPDLPWWMSLCSEVVDAPRPQTIPHPR